MASAAPSAAPHARRRLCTPRTLSPLQASSEPCGDLDALDALRPAGRDAAGAAVLLLCGARLPPAPWAPGQGDRLWRWFLARADASAAAGPVVLLYLHAGVEPRSAPPAAWAAAAGARLPARVRASLKSLLIVHPPSTPVLALLAALPPWLAIAPFVAPGDGAGGFGSRTHFVDRLELLSSQHGIDPASLPLDDAVREADAEREGRPVGSGAGEEGEEGGGGGDGGAAVFAPVSRPADGAPPTRALAAQLDAMAGVPGYG